MRRALISLHFAWTNHVLGLVDDICPLIPPYVLHATPQHTPVAALLTEAEYSHVIVLVRIPNPSPRSWEAWLLVVRRGELVTPRMYEHGLPGWHTGWTMPGGWTRGY